MAGIGEVLGCGVLVVGPNGRDLEFASTRARELLAWPEGEVAAPGWAALESEIEQVVARMILHRHRVARLDVEVSASGRARPLRLDLCRLGKEAGGAVLVVARDPKAIEESEADRRLAGQLRALHGLARGAAHALKGPLNVISLNVELLHTTHASSEEPARRLQERSTRAIREQIERLDHLQNALMAQISAPAEARERLDLRRLIGDLEPLLAAQAEHQQVRLFVGLPGAPVLVEGHRGRLGQVCLKLAIQVLETMADGGQLEIRLDAKQDRAEITVSDRGPGWPPGILDAIFRSQFTPQPGGGSGLQVARADVEADGGSLRLESQPGRGSSFVVVLPIAAGP